MSKYSGLIIISHQTFERISKKEILEAIPEEWKQLDRQILEVKPILKKLGDESGLDWKSAARQQASIWKNTILAAIHSNPSYGLVYFGLAHIPLAIHLGHLMGSAQDCEIFQKHHESNKWIYDSSSKQFPLFVSEGEPKEKFIAQGEVSLRFSTHYRIKKTDVESFPDFAAAHIYKKTQGSDIDSFTSMAGAQRGGIEFRNALDEVKNYLPNVAKLHLFAAVPVGVALMMGKQVSPTIHFDKEIQIYNYQEGRYEPCFVLQSLERESLILSGNEIKKIQNLREELNECLERQIKPYVKGIPVGEESWYNLISQELMGSVFSESSWNSFPDLSKTYLHRDTIDLEDTDSTQFYKNGKWIITNYFLGAVIRRFGEDNEGIIRAFRMFLFHEALHFSFQRLTENIAAGIGRFPKVLERADYEADVWAMFQEYAFSNHYNLLSGKTPQEFFADLHLKSANIMWAFDVAESDPDEMQVRRIIRYLSLYFNLARVRDRGVSSLFDIANCLGNIPVIDLKGLSLKTDSEGRVIASLDQFDPSKLAIGVYHQNKVYRLGSIETSFEISDLVNALRERDPEKVVNFTAKIWDHVKSI